MLKIKIAKLGLFLDHIEAYLYIEAGKSTAGRLDCRIGAEVPLIFELEGEVEFRERQKILTAELVQRRGRLSYWQQMGGGR